MKKLSHPFPSVVADTGVSFGGNQKWFPYKFLQKVGCGVIGTTDLLWYLSRHQENCKTEIFEQVSRGTISVAEYQKLALEIWKRYMPVFPGFGVNGIGLMLGINRYFWKHHIPLKARWGISKRKLWLRMDVMLDSDIPVILAVGPNFPNVWGKRTLNFYNKKKDGTYSIANRTNAHYVTVTGKDGSWIQISSWGKEYYINRREYQQYVEQYSNYLVSNLLYIH